MVCIYCGSETNTYNSRMRRLNPSVWRRRRCKVCVAQFSTIELPDYSISLAIESTNGKIASFSRDKLFLSIFKALGHRSDAVSSATELTNTAIGAVLRKQKGHQGVIKAESLARQTHLILKRFDHLAAHTYKAYHKAALKGRVSD